MKKVFFLVSFLAIVLQSSLFAGVLDFLPYHPDIPNKSLSPYSMGFTAFGVDDPFIKSNELNLLPVYSFFSGYPKSSPDESKDIYQFSLSDTSDPYQGYFYKLNFDNTPLLIHVNANYSRQDESKKSGAINIAEGRLDLSTKLGDFYLGAMSLYQNIKDNVSISDYYYMGSGTFQEYNNQITDSNFYYQLSLGYKLNKSTTFSLKYDNIYNLSSNRDSTISFQNDLLNSNFIPQYMVTTLVSSIYRFNSSGGNNYYFHSNYAMFNYDLLEKLDNLTTHHSELQVNKKFSLFEINLNLDYSYLEYQSDLITMTSMSDEGIYNKSGNFKNLELKLVLKSFNLISSINKLLLLTISYDNLLYSKISEDISFVSGMVGDNSISQKISFSQNKVSLLISYINSKTYEFHFFTLVKQNSFYNNIRGTSQTAMYGTIFNEIYPDLWSAAPDYSLSQSGEGTSIHTGMANRYYVSEKLRFDLGLAFYHIDYDAKNTLKTDFLIASVGFWYQLVPEQTLELTYQHTNFFTYEVQDQTYRATQDTVSLTYKAMF